MKRRQPGSLELHARAHQLAREFDGADPQSSKRFMAARELLSITAELEGRGNEALLFDPRFESDIWQVGGGPGDPMIGSLSSYVQPYANIAIYRDAVAAWAKFGTMYAGTEPTYQDYKAGLGPTKASHDTGGHPLHPSLTRDELLEIYTEIANDQKALTRADEIAAFTKTIDQYVARLNQAFRILRLDTVETQASYLANAYIESSQFRFMTETEKSSKSNKPYQAVPQDVQLDLTWLTQAATGKVPYNGGVLEVTGYGPNGAINPAGDWQKSFLGRGPLQVTNRTNYLKSLAILENRAEEMENEDPTSPDYADLLQAIHAIKQDPREAANPKWAFLLSAAFMRILDPNRNLRGDEKANRGEVTSWMGPQVEKAKKDAAYAVAFRILSAKAVPPPN